MIKRQKAAETEAKKEQIDRDKVRARPFLIPLNAVFNIRKERK